MCPSNNLKDQELCCKHRKTYGHCEVEVGFDEEMTAEEEVPAVQQPDDAGSV